MSIVDKNCSTVNLFERSVDHLLKRARHLAAVRERHAVLVHRAAISRNGTEVLQSSTLEEVLD
jgi:hypothetical protein